MEWVWTGWQTKSPKIWSQRLNAERKPWLDWSSYYNVRQMPPRMAVHIVYHSFNTSGIYIYTQSKLHMDKQRKYCMHNSPFGTYGNVCTSCDQNHFTTLCYFLITSFRLFRDTRHIHLSLCISSKQIKLCKKNSLMKKQLPLTCKYIFYKHAPKVTTLQKKKEKKRRSSKAGDKKQNKNQIKSVQC